MRPASASPSPSVSSPRAHSFTLSLRHQLQSTPIEVVELVPPAVRTNLGGSHDFGVPLAEYADSVMAGLAAGHAEVTHEFSAKASQTSRAELDAYLKNLNKR